MVCIIGIQSMTQRHEDLSKNLLDAQFICNVQPFNIDGRVLEQKRLTYREYTM